MKPVLLITEEYPPQHGGIATYLAALVRAFPADGIRVLAPIVRDADPMQGVIRRKLSSGWLRPRWLAALFWIARVCAQEQPSAIVVSHILPFGTLARFMMRAKKIPYAVIVHGMDIAALVEGEGSKQREARRVLDDARLVIANSAFTSVIAKKLGVAEKALRVVTPPSSFPLDVAVDPAAVAAVRSDCGCGPDDVLVLTTCRLVERKGVDTMLRALAAMSSRKKIVYVVVGDGPDAKRVQTMAKDLGVDDRTLFKGAVDNATLAAYFAACDVFAMLARSIGTDVEGYGIVYRDAGVFGKPVLAGRTGGVPEAVLDRETGLLIDPNDHKQAALELGRLADEPELRHRLGAAARARQERDARDGRFERLAADLQRLGEL